MNQDEHFREINLKIQRRESNKIVCEILTNDKL